MSLPTVLSSGLPAHVLGQARENLPRRRPKHDNDVFGFVMRYVSDSEYSQTPLITWPGCVLGDTLDAFERLSSGNCRGCP